MSKPWSSAITLTNERTGVSLTRVTFGGSERCKRGCKCEGCEKKASDEADEIVERMTRRGIINGA